MRASPWAWSEKLRLIELAFARSQLTGMTPDRVAASIASFDFLYLSELERARIVAPSVRGGDSRVHVAQQGGHVLEPETGLHANVWVFDFKSLYPSIIRTFNIDPVSYVPEPAPDLDLIRTTEGAFRREPAILPRLLDELFPRREAAKRRGDEVAAHAIKILMNSFYGVLGTSACRFFNPALANSITGMGKHLLLWSKQWFEAAGFQRAVRRHRQPVRALRRERPATGAAPRPRGSPPSSIATSSATSRRRWRVRSRLELEFEKLYLKLFLPRARHSTRGASKRYAGLVYSAADAGAVEFVGMEVIRRDATLLAKRVQRELYERLFSNRPVDAYLAEIVARVRRGELDEELVYHKNLRKEHGRVHRDDTAARRRGAQVPPGARQIHPLRRDHGRARSRSTICAIRSTASTMSRSR